MNRINRKLEYALIALKHMSQKRPGELTTVKEICRAYGCPFDATSRVMQVLANREFLRSEQGAHGGYQILRDLKKVSLHELIEVVIGPVGIAKCMPGGISHCDLASNCNIASPIFYLNERLVEFYRDINVHDLLAVEQYDCRKVLASTTSVGARGFEESQSMTMAE